MADQGAKNTKEDKIVMDAFVAEVLPEGKFRLRMNVSGSEHLLIGYESGKMRMNYIKLIVGDRVRVEISKYDITKARIVFRY